MTRRSSDEPDITAGRVVSILLAVAGIVLLWQIASVVLMLFGAVLGAILVDAGTRGLQRSLRLPRAAAFALMLITIGLLALGLAVVIGPQLLQQTEHLVEELPDSLNRITREVGYQSWAKEMLPDSPEQFLPPPMEIVGRITGVFSMTFGVVTGTVFAVIVSIYLAADPDPYIRGITALTPAHRSARAREIMSELGRALRWWLVGRFISMVAVAVMTVIGLWLIGLPAALALGLLAGLLAFVPFVGPVVSIVPALLIALTQGVAPALWVIVLYAGVQFLEGNFVTPLVQERTVALPPAMLLTAQLIGGILFGLIGVLLATPLAVAVIVLVQTLYVEDVLGRRVCLLGEHGPVTAKARRG